MIGAALKALGVLARLALLPSCGGGGDGSGGPLSTAPAAGAQRIDRAEFVTLSADSSTVGYAGAPTDTAGLPANTGAFLNALLYTIATGARTLASLDPSRTSAGNGITGALRISADGRVVAFTSRATNLVAGISYPASPGGQVLQQLFARNLATGTTQLVSIDATGTTGANLDDVADRFAISADGRYVAFASKATNLVLGVTYPGGNNVFVRDLVAGSTELISISADGRSAGFNGAVPVAPVHDSLFPAISDDGRYVAFTSAATNLVTGVGYPRLSPSISNVYLRDRSLRSTRLLSLSQDGTQASNDPCGVPSSWAAGRYMTPDGSAVVFTCRASNLIPGLLYPANPSDVYLWRRDTGALTLVSRSSNGTAAANNGAFEAVVSADGQFVAFQSPSSNLVTGVIYFTGGIGPGGPPISNIFRWDRSSGTVQLLTRSRDGTSGADFDMQFPVISDDGQVVAFASAATNVTTPSVTLTFDDRQDNAAFWTAATNSVTLASVDASNRPKGFVNPFVALSSNGNVVVFLWNFDRSAYILRR
jgi:Tol biopolymer transport system component